eukprot:m.16207 g.16207  ORF g.16207 m.16207 type:complete len:230 (-) comp5616_c0_seq1:18-707(-)
MSAQIVAGYTYGGPDGCRDPCSVGFQRFKSGLPSSFSGPKFPQATPQYTHVKKTIEYKLNKEALQMVESHVNWFTYSFCTCCDTSSRSGVDVMQRNFIEPTNEFLQNFGMYVETYYSQGCAGNYISVIVYQRHDAPPLSQLPPLPDPETGISVLPAGVVQQQPGVPIHQAAPPYMAQPTGQGYPPPTQGYPPPGQGYPAPGQGYPAPGQGYPPPTQGYPPQEAPPNYHQ